MRSPAYRRALRLAAVTGGVAAMAATPLAGAAAAPLRRPFISHLATITRIA